MVLSNTCIYGLRASVLLAGKTKGEYVTVREMSDELDISFHFLTKVLQKLTRSQLLKSYKGPNGGIRLAKPANSITFMDVVLAIDGDAIVHECALGLPGCGILKPCPLHDQWSGLKENMLRMMENVSLQELALNGRSPQPDLSSLQPYQQPG